MIGSRSSSVGYVPRGPVVSRDTPDVAADHLASKPCKGYLPMAYRERSDVARAVGVCEAALGLVSVRIELAESVVVCV